MARLAYASQVRIAVIIRSTITMINLNGWITPTHRAQHAYGIPSQDARTYYPVPIGRQGYRAPLPTAPRSGLAHGLDATHLGSTMPLSVRGPERGIACRGMQAPTLPHPRASTEGVANVCC